MGIAAAVLSGFVLAAFAPAIYRLGRRTTGWILALLPIGLFAYFLGYLGQLPAAGLVVGWPWVPSLGLQFSFLLDGLSLLFALLISGIGAIILVYAGGYLAGDRQLGRLYALLLMFMASMLGVVLADNMLTLFVFWELTSLSSYLLIGFDHERPAARAGALQALLVTASGGLALMAAALLLGQVGADAGLPAEQIFELSSLTALGDAVRDHALYEPILILILLGAFTKSAQVPFHFWLPSAMEAPTPVSAYLHSATMVKAGVYLLARLSPIMSGTDLWLWSVTGFGAATMLVGAVLAIQALDLKRALAYSTVSALGMLVLLIGLGSPGAIQAAVTFLLAHALYKAALFLVAGGIDHATGTRNVEQLSGLATAMPLTAVAAGIAALSMSGFPPLFGFIAKEMFYEATLESAAALVLTSAAVIASMLFVAVAIMVGLRPFLGERSEPASHAHEGSIGLWLGPVLLAVLSVGLAFRPEFVDPWPLAAASGAILDLEMVEPLHLALWHGWNATLLLSGVTFLGGVALYFARNWLRLPAVLVAWGPARFYELSLRGLNAVASLQTNILQSGYLRLYLLTILLTSALLVGYTLIIRTSVELSLDWLDIAAHEAALVLLIAVSIVVAVLSTSRLSAIVALGGVGYGVALIFILFGAPDLAMTQFLVETLTVILFVLVFYHAPPGAPISRLRTRIRDAAVAIVVGGLITMLILLASSINFFPTISNYYGEQSLAEAHGRNVVNVILVDYRALDTLGEITVLSVAGVGVYALLKLRLNGAKNL